MPGIQERYRKWLANLALAAGSLLIALIAVELLLRQWPEVLGYEFATRVLNKYSMAPDGIYYADPSLKMLFMKPSFVTEQYWNGYRWHHQTDDLGFRNPQTRTRADIVLLGDSLIYGHGVNIEDTVGVLLERRSSHSVVNLGTQGHSAFQEAYLTAEYVPKFRPRYVFYFFFDNDIVDLYRFLTDQEMRDFIERDVSRITYKERAGQVTSRKSWSDFLRPKLYVGRAVDQLMVELKLKKQITPMQLPKDRLHDIHDENSLAWQYTKHAILYMDSVAKTSQAKFVVVPLVLHEKPYFAVLQNFARQHQIPFLERARVYDWDSTHFLPRDGHFNGAGAAAMAELLAEFLRKMDYDDCMRAHRSGCSNPGPPPN